VGNLTFGTITPLLSHAAAGAGRVRTLLMSQPEGGKGTCEPARSDTLNTVGLQTLVSGSSRQVRGLPKSK